MQTPQRHRILVISSSAVLRERAAATLAQRYEVTSYAEWNADILTAGISLAVVDERNRAAFGGPAPSIPVINMREASESDELLERVETRIELARLRTASVRPDVQMDMLPDDREPLRFLVSAAEAMAGAPSLDEALRHLCTAAVPRLAQWCSITMREGSQLVARAAWHESPEKLHLLENIGRFYPPLSDRRHPVYRVISTGRSEFVSQLPPSFYDRLAGTEQQRRLMGELGMASFMCVPLCARGVPIGALLLGADADWRPLSRADLILAEQLGARMGSAIERARLLQTAEAELAERMRVESVLRRQEHDQALILNTVKAMIWFKDAFNRILRCNRAAAKWAGSTPEHIEGRKVEELFPAALARAYHESDLAVIASGRPKLGVLENIQSRGGVKRWVQRDTLPYRDEQGAIIGVVIIAVDVTALKRAEDLAAAKERAEREFLANVSHEFRTPVAAIKGFTHTLRSGAWKDPVNRERFIRIIENNADRLDSLVGDLITLSAIEGAPRPRSVAVELKPLTIESARKIVTQARRKGVALAVSVPRGLRAKMDRLHLLQALEHLLNNAVKFTPPGGSIRIRARRSKAKAKIWVEDSGIGIPRTELPRVFNRFYRVAKGAAPGNPGLGLHLVKRLIDSYGGKVSVKSRVARGSSFCLELPAAVRPKRRRRNRPEPSTSSTEHGITACQDTESPYPILTTGLS